MKKILIVLSLSLSLGALAQTSIGISSSGGLSCYNLSGKLCIPNPSPAQGCSNGSVLVASDRCGEIAQYCKLRQCKLEQNFIKESSYELQVVYKLRAY
jgi:hypothetical protein